jgi:hypothetical protein
VLIVAAWLTDLNHFRYSILLTSEDPAIAAKKSPSLFAQLLLYEVDKGRRAATALPRHAVAALSYGDTPLYIQGSEEMRLA